MPLQEHLIRSVTERDLPYWISLAANAGWVMRACTFARADVLVVFERPLTSLTARLADECRYARNLEELAVGLEGLLGGLVRPTMPSVAVQRQYTENGSQLHLVLWAGTQEFARVVLAEDRSEWYSDDLVSLFQCADNVLEVFKVNARQIKAALSSPDVVSALGTVLGARVQVQASGSGRNIQIARGDEARYLSAWGKQPVAQLVIQSVPGGDPPWMVLGLAERVAAEVIAESLPGCVR